MAQPTPMMKQRKLAGTAPFVFPPALVSRLVPLVRDWVVQMLLVGRRYRTQLLLLLGRRYKILLLLLRDRRLGNWDLVGLVARSGIGWWLRILIWGRR